MEGINLVSICALCGGLLSVAGFVALWLKMGIEKGQNDNRLAMVEKRQDKQEQEIDDLSKEQHSMSTGWASFCGEIRANIEYIKQSIDDLKERQGGER